MFENLCTYLKVDEVAGLIYFIGLREGPLERHLYCTSYLWDIGNAPNLLTEPGFSHTVDMDEVFQLTFS